MYACQPNETVPRISEWLYTSTLIIYILHLFIFDLKLYKLYIWQWIKLSQCDKFIKEFLNICPNWLTVWNYWEWCDSPSHPPNSYASAAIRLTKSWYITNPAFHPRRLLYLTLDTSKEYLVENRTQGARNFAEFEMGIPKWRTMLPCFADGKSLFL